MKQNYHDHGLGIAKHLLQDYQDKAKNQDLTILEIFKVSELTLGPSQIHRIFQGEIPITSIRRAVSNLTRDGFLEKLTLNRVKGMYGREECTWRLRLETDCG